MKFCERFHMTPFEYRALPQGLIKTWLQMSRIEAGKEKATEE